jgi:hypothetical protein
MKKLIVIGILAFFAKNISAQSPVGKWRVVSEINSFQGQTFDSHKALLQQRPCAAKIYYEINPDGTFRLNASQSSCDANYVNIQQKLNSESVWTLAGNKITIGHRKAPTVGQTYTIKITGNKMQWVGTDGQGTITYQKL